MTWPAAWDGAAFQAALGGWGEMCGVSLPSALMIFAEWWAWEANLFLAGLLCGDHGGGGDHGGDRGGDHGGDRGGGSSSGTDGGHISVLDDDEFAYTAPVSLVRSLLSSTTSSSRISPDASSPTCVELEAFPIVSNTMVLGFFVHAGFSFGAANHVGALLGRGDPAAARLAAHVALSLAGGISGCLATALVHKGDPPCVVAPSPCGLGQATRMDGRFCLLHRLCCPLARAAVSPQGVRAGLVGRSLQRRS
jgi:hypothetical protein